MPSNSQPDALPPFNNILMDFPYAHPYSPAYNTQLTLLQPSNSTSSCACRPTASAAPTQTETPSRRRLLLCISFSVIFAIILPVISVLTGLNLHARDLFYKPTSEMVPFVGRQVLMEVVLVAADPTAQTMTLDWTFLGEETSPCSAANLTGCTDINVFFDEYVSLCASPSVSY